MFLHDSVKTDFFRNDRKLNLLRKGVISVAQFVSLIEQKDDYLLIGPAVVAKGAVKDFILEWKMRQLHMDAVKGGGLAKVSYDGLAERLDDLDKAFPEIALITKELREQLKVAVCPKCVKRQYLGLIVQKIKGLKGDGRDLSPVADFIGLLEGKFGEGEDGQDEDGQTRYDVEWLRPEPLIGLGSDLIANLGNCFECVIKRLGRAKILYEECLTGYPGHARLSFDELDKGTKAIEQAYITYLDSMGQLDMASCELIGDLTSLPDGWSADMIELANEIRQARLMCQADPEAAPDFDGLRLKVKRLELRTKRSLDGGKADGEAK